MEKKMYYAITTRMIFEKTVLVPVDEVEDIFDAIKLVDDAVEVCSIDLLNEDADCETVPSEYVGNNNGIYECNDDMALCYQIIHNIDD